MTEQIQETLVEKQVRLVLEQQCANTFRKLYTGQLKRYAFTFIAADFGEPQTALRVPVEVIDAEFADVDEPIDTIQRHACLGTWGRGPREACSVCMPVKTGDTVIDWMAAQMPPKSERP